MKILVPTKRVPDTDQKIVAAADGTRVAADHIAFVINPFDAIALEEAVRISETNSEPVEVVVAEDPVHSSCGELRGREHPDVAGDDPLGELIEAHAGRVVVTRLEVGSGPVAPPGQRGVDRLACVLRDELSAMRD